MQNFEQIKEYIRKSYICVDSYDDGSFSARLYKTPSSKPIVFTELVDMVNELDGYYDSIAYPQSSTTPRRFKDPKKKDTSEVKEQTIDEEETDAGTVCDIYADENKGKIATFILQVVYRQHASWQGSLCWVEKNITKAFRSELELFKLIGLALGDK